MLSSVSMSGYICCLYCLIYTYTVLKSSMNVLNSNWLMRRLQVKQDTVKRLCIIYVMSVCVFMTISVTQFGNQLFEDVKTTSVECEVLQGVECSGNRMIVKHNVPCVR